MSGASYPGYGPSAGPPPGPQWGQPQGPMGPPPGYGMQAPPVAYAPPARKRREKIGIPIFIVGFALLGIGILLIGVGFGDLENISFSGLSGSSENQASHNDLNLTFIGIDLMGAGVIVIGIGVGLNVAARFSQNDELGRQGP